MKFVKCWTKKLFEELKTSNPLPIKVHYNNKDAISIAHNPVLYDRTKYVEVDKHFINEKIKNGLICMMYIPTIEQIMCLQKDFIKNSLTY